MALSNSYDYTVTRDSVITRALRIVNAIGQGETPTSTAITEAAEPLNDVIKELGAIHGMPVYNVVTYTLPTVSGTASYSLSTSNTPFLEVTNVQKKNKTSGTFVNLTRMSYQDYLNSTSRGLSPDTPREPHSFVFVPQGASYGAATPTSSVILYPAPDANYIAAYDTIVYGFKQWDDMDASGDNLAFPQHWFNTVKWLLADQLSYEYGVPLAERSMITKKAQQHLTNSLSGDTEQMVSLFIQPDMSGK